MRKLKRRALNGFSLRFHRDRRRAPRGTPERRSRRNKVKFRRRYAAARLKTLGEFFWISSRLAVIAAVLVWGGGMGWQAWKQSEYLRVQLIRYDGDIPAKLPPSLPLRKGIGLFSFDADAVEANLLKRFPELAKVEVNRALDRSIVVRGRYREPVAILSPANVLTGVDALGMAFPIPESAAPVRSLPVLEAQARDRAGAVAVLRLWERKLPKLFDVVKKLECDRMRSFRVELSDGVIVEWGAIDLSNAVEKGSKVLRLMTSFSPEKSPARLRFVTDDRIVMDAAWQPSAGKTREGDHIVKT